jgi:hypothetical protein
LDDSIILLYSFIEDCVKASINVEEILNTSNASANLAKADRALLMQINKYYSTEIQGALGKFPENSIVRFHLKLILGYCKITHAYAIAALK